MARLLRKIGCFNRNSLIRAVVVAASGSSLLYFSGDTDSPRKTVFVSILAPLQESVSLLCQGNLPLFVSRTGSIPSYDINKNGSPYKKKNRNDEASGDAVDDSKSCCGYSCRDSIATAAAIVSPAVVNISVPWRLNDNKGIGTGSGTVIDSAGTILTCAHVVAGSRGKKITSEGKVDVTLPDGRTFVGTVLNVDLHADIAVVKINSGTPVPAAKIGSSRKLRSGDWVIAMGSPHSLHNTVTAGIVSCVDRKSNEMGLGGMLREYIQMDCAINPGNSGGPLVNLDGEVVGVNIMRISTANGLGFAVPIDSVFKIMEQFKKDGRAIRPWLGLKMLDLNKMIIAQLRERDATFPNVKGGVLVPMVTPGSPADYAGFCPGDVVIEFDGKPVGNISEIVQLMEGKVGIPLKVTVKRAEDVSATLSVVPEEANPQL